MKYFGIYNNSGDVQTALAEFALAKPYVAIVSGALDYDSQRAPRTAPYIVDSLGNEYEGIYNGENWHFNDFTKPLSATFTLYSQDENVVTAATLYDSVGYTCNGEIAFDAWSGATSVENYAVQNFNNLVPVETGSSSAITVIVDYFDSSGFVGIEFRYENCNMYHKIDCMNQSLCWDEDNQECGECPVGAWSDDGAGRYTLTILDDGSEAWEQYDGEHFGSRIATAPLYFLANQTLYTFDIWLSEADQPKVSFVPTSGYMYAIDYQFFSGSETQDTQYRVYRTDATSKLYLEWDEDEKTLTFYSGSENNPLSMTTYDVENPDA